MKRSFVLTSLLFLTHILTVRAWQTGQAADLILGAIPSNGPLREGTDLVVEPATGKLYVLDSPSGRVLRYGSEAKLFTNSPPEAVFGKPDLAAGINNTISATNIVFAGGIAVDSGGRLWVGGGNRILRWDNAATRTSGAAADGVFGGPDFTSVYATSDPKRIGSLVRLTVDAAGNLFVSSSDRNSILRFDAAATKALGAAPDAYFGQTSFTNTTAGLSQSRLNGPRDIVVRGATLWVNDVLNKRILRLNNAATRTSGAPFDAVIGQDGFFTSTNTTLTDCSGMDISAAGGLYTARGRVVRLWANAYTLSGLLPAPQFTSDTFQGTNLSAIHFESETRVWLGATDVLSGPAGSVPVRRMEASPSVSYLGVSPGSSLRSPWQAAVDPLTGKVFVSDTPDHSIKRFASAASLASHAQPELIITGGISTPMGICLDSAGRLWVADYGNSRIVRWNNAGTMAASRPPDGVFNPGSFTAPYNEASIHSPYAVTVDAGGTLWMVDYFLARALRYDNAVLKGGIVPADGMLGKTDYADPNTGGEPWRYLKPTRAQFDAAGNLWVMDSGGANEATGTVGNDIRIFRYNNPNSKPVGALPDATIKFSNSATGANSFAVTSDNTLWVAVSKPYPHILRFDNASTLVNGTPASGQIGTSPAGAGASQFGGVVNALNTDAAGNLWVADNNSNRRVMRFSANPPPAPPAGQVLSVSRSAAGFQFTFTGVPDRYYFVESSADLQTWTPNTAVKAMGPLQTFLDTAPAGVKRFYHVREMP